MANEVKRYIPDSTPIYLVGESTSEPTTCVVLGRDHERIVAAKDAEIAILKSRASQFESTLKETMRVRDEIIAEHKRMIDEAIAIVERRMKSDESCGHHFDEDLGELLKSLRGAKP